MSWWKSLLSWFVKSGAAEAAGKQIVKKVSKAKGTKESAK